MLLRSVRKTGLASDDDLRKSIMDGRALIWIAEEDKAIKGAAVTEIYDTGAAVRCNILALSGAGFDEWSHLGSVIEDYARENGCTTLALVGRKGWARKLRNKGFVLTNVVMERRL